MRVLILIFIFIFNVCFTYEHEVCVLSIFKNESNYLEEWIEYHQSIGVEKFILYNHFSTDNYQNVLQPYIKSGLVELRHWEGVEYPKALLDAFQHAISTLKNKTKWLAVIDVDEFIVLPNQEKLASFLKKYDKYAGLVLNWQLFGTSDVQNLSPGTWITEHLTKKAVWNYDNPQWSSNYYVKSIIRPEFINEKIRYPQHAQCGNHVFMPIKGKYLVNSNKESVEINCKTHRVLIDKIYINHYWFRTIDWFYSEKMSRQSSVGSSYSNEKIQKIINDTNQVEDFEILKNSLLKDKYNHEIL